MPLMAQSPSSSLWNQHTHMHSQGHTHGQCWFPSIWCNSPGPNTSPLILFCSLALVLVLLSPWTLSLFSPEFGPSTPCFWSQGPVPPALPTLLSKKAQSERKDVIVASRMKGWQEMEWWGWGGERPSVSTKLLFFGLSDFSHSVNVKTKCSAGDSLSGLSIQSSHGECFHPQKTVRVEVTLLQHQCIQRNLKKGPRLSREHVGNTKKGPKTVISNKTLLRAF